MSRLRIALISFMFSACATVLPMQTASVVAPGHTRVGGQVTAAAFCGSPVVGIGGVLLCNQFPDGLPLPELRANVRRGLGWSSDVGGSLQLLGQVQAPEQPVQVGATVDVKRELLHLKTESGLAHILSLGALGGAAISGRAGLAAIGQAEWGVPLLYGLQTTRFEWVAGLQISQRFQFGGRPDNQGLNAIRFGATLGLYRREPVSWGLQLAYLTDTRTMERGTLQLQFGWQWEIGD